MMIGKRIMVKPNQRSIENLGGKVGIIADHWGRVVWVKMPFFQPIAGKPDYGVKLNPHEIIFIGFFRYYFGLLCQLFGRST